MNHLRLQNEMNRLFDDFWGVGTETQARTSVWQPACDVVEDKDHYLLNLEVAGIPKDQIKIEVIDQKLVISGERKHEEVKKEKGVRYTERQYGSFYRSFALPSGLDLDKVEANYQDGILKVLVPKMEDAKPRQIKINGGSGTRFFDKLIGQPSSKEKGEDQTSSSLAS